MDSVRKWLINIAFYLCFLLAHAQLSDELKSEALNVVSRGDELSLTLHDESYERRISHKTQTYHLGDWIFLQVSPPNKGAVVKIEACSLSSKLPLTGGNSVQLFSDGCPLDVRYALRLESHNGSARFKVKADIMRSSLSVYCVCSVALSDDGKEACNLTLSCPRIFPVQEKDREQSTSVSSLLPALSCREPTSCSHGCSIWKGQERCAEKAVLKKKKISPKSLNVTSAVDSRAVQNSVDVCSVGAIHANHGTISTPNYPQNYANSRQCSKSIVVDQDKIIEFRSLDFILESRDLCDYDYLEVYDHKTKLGNTKYCGVRSPINFTSTTNNLTINFKSDSTSASRGFIFSWAAKDRCPDDKFTCWNGSCIDIKLKCDGNKDCADDSDEIVCDRKPASYGQCGKTSVPPEFTVTQRIVGGEEVRVGSWPWQVFLLIGEKGTSVCGGTIISSRWILTAAHCLEGITNNFIEAYIGLHNTQSAHSHTRKVGIDEVLINPVYYASKKLAYDVGLLKTSTEMVFNDFVRPVCLPPVGVEFPTGSVCIATGYGRLHFNGPVATTLHQVRVPLIEFSKCYERYPYRILQDSHICAGNIQDGGVDACQGDSGGPLICLYSGSTWFQVGITSFGRGCADSRYPGVYTRTAGIQSWVIEKTGVSLFRKVGFCDSTHETSGVSGELTYESAEKSSAECEKSIVVENGKNLRIKIENLLPLSNQECMSNSLIISDKKMNYEVKLSLPNRSASYLLKENRVSIKMKAQCFPINFRVIWEAVDGGESSGGERNDSSHLTFVTSLLWMTLQYVSILFIHLLSLLRLNG